MIARVDIHYISVDVHPPCIYVCFYLKTNHISHVFSYPYLCPPMVLEGVDAKDHRSFCATWHFFGFLGIVKLLPSLAYFPGRTVSFR